MNKEFTRVRSIKDLTISSLLTIIGCALVALPTSTSINLLGFFMIFAGIILFMALRSAYKDIETGNIYKKTEYFFSQSMRQEISNAIASKPEAIRITEEDKGNGVRLDIYHNQKTGKAFLQLFEYVPYKYEPCSRVYEYKTAEINRLLK